MRVIPSSLPVHGRALLGALQFQEPDCSQLEAMDDLHWRKLLSLADRVQLTLTLRHDSRRAMPAWVRDRVDRDARNNTIRFQNTGSLLLEIATEFESRGIDYAVLKGFTHSPHFTPDPATRAQSDCDLWVAPEALGRANDALTEMGFTPLCGSVGRHLPPMARPSEWTWTGDYFAPDLPISVDIHYKLWDEQAEKVPAPGEQEFWARRVLLEFMGKPLPALCVEDTLAFAAIHLLMHLFHGDLRLHRAWEIAHFLHHRANDRDFWRAWEQLHPPKLRTLQAVVFALVTQWFSCDVPQEVADEIKSLSDPVQSWIEQSGWSPVRGLFDPNRDELWLRLALMDSGFDKLQVFLYRMLPLPKPGQAMTLSRFTSKALYHVRSLPPTLVNGIAWWWKSKGFSEGFVAYLAGSALFDAGAFIFVLLYNLFLLDHGFRAQLIGQVSGCMTAGTLVAAVPAAWLCRRYGLRNALIVSVVGAALAAGLRAATNQPLALMATAFLHGLFFSIWAVCYSPTVAAFTNEKNRTLGFSFTCGMGMSLGVGAGFVGGRLPSLFQSLGLSHDSPGAKRMALFAAASLIMIAVIPISRLKVSTQPKPEARSAVGRIYPRTVFFACFLFVSCVWSLATNAFNPFFNTYFVDRYHMTVERIGSIFSLSQFTQVIAVFLAPALLRWIGDIRGIAAVQLMTACMMALLVPKFPAPVCAAIFIGYMSFQYMTSPSLFSLIMSHVSREEQSGASALNFVITSVAGVASAFAAGAMIERNGYSQLIATCAALAVCAAVLTGTLLSADSRSAEFAAAPAGVE